MSEGSERRERLRKRERHSLTGLAPGPALQLARELRSELDEHEALRVAVTKERDTLACMYREENGNELCDDSACTHCVLTAALNGTGS